MSGTFLPPGLPYRISVSSWPSHGKPGIFPKYRQPDPPPHPMAFEYALCFPSTLARRLTCRRYDVFTHHVNLHARRLRSEDHLRIKMAGTSHSFGFPYPKLLSFHCAGFHDLSRRFSCITDHLFHPSECSRTDYVRDYLQVAIVP